MTHFCVIAGSGVGLLSAAALLQRMPAEYLDVPLPENVCISPLLIDYAVMSEVLGFLPFDEFTRGYEAIDVWFAARSVPIPMPLVS